MSDDLSTALFWAPVMFAFFMAFRRWARRPLDTWTWCGVEEESRRENEVWTNAPHYNRATWSALPAIMGDHEYRPFALDAEREA